MSNDVSVNAGPSMTGAAAAAPVPHGVAPHRAEPEEAPAFAGEPAGPTASGGTLPEPKVAPRRRSHRGSVIVGISASHDASACVLRDGKIEAAIQLERITRKKRDGHGFLHSRAAVDYCLQAAGLRASDVDVFAFNAQPLRPDYVGLNVPTHDQSFELFDPFSERAMYVSHHLCHAFGAFASSPYPEAAVFVADGSGGTTFGADDLVLRGPELQEYLERGARRETAAAPHAPRRGVHVQSSYVFDEAGFRLLDREVAPSFNVYNGSASIGELYAAVSQYVFGNWQESGKLMGLAPYGVPDEFGPSLLERDERGRLQFSAGWKNRCRSALVRGEPLAYRHLAARVQRDLEEALVERVRELVRASKQTSLAYAGGVALNSVANQRLRHETGVERLYVMPASHDAGISIGAAAAARHALLGHTRRPPLESDFFGRPYSDQEYRAAIAEYRELLDERPYDLGDVTERLIARQVIGWFEGGSEFGPRALGHRSIFAAPQAKSMWDYINRRIKFREDFRPFAPLVPLEQASRYFELDEPSPYMLRVVQVRPEFRHRLGAVTHVDGSARLQTVERGLLPRVHALLESFGHKSGMPVLINTSLNVRSEPIVETPQQAIELLLSTHLDALVLGDQVLTPRRTSERGLGFDDRIVLPPKTEVLCSATRTGHQAKLTALARGKLEYALPSWAFHVLSAARGLRPLGELLAEHLPPDVSRAEALRLLSALHDLRLILVAGTTDRQAEGTTESGGAR